jgi:Fic-DOC domain mobile mystery protein B
MGLGAQFEYPPGATPLDPDDAAGLIPSHISTQGQLNEWEFQNVFEGRAWALSRKRKDLLTADFTRELHRRMFGKTWKWAGTIRKKETNPGIDPSRIAVELKKLFDDVAYQVKQKSMPFDEIAATFHHRLTQIHPFANGNGRHARLMTDLLLRENGVEPFDWGNNDLVEPGEVRDRYIRALRAADGRDHSLLFKFVRSGGDKET